MVNSAELMTRGEFDREELLFISDERPFSSDESMLFSSIWKKNIIDQRRKKSFQPGLHKPGCKATEDG